MRYIRKGTEPRDLLAYRKSLGASYEAMPSATRDTIRDALLRDQGHLCAYCMQRITAATMKIEHRVPQSVDASQQLAWPNLLGCCKGAEGSPPREQHCDTCKGDTPITVDPTDARCTLQVRYTGDGRIASNDPVIERDLDATLHLNLPMLLRNRNAVLSAFLAKLRTLRGDVDWTAALTRELDALQSPDAQGHLREYCGYVAWWIRRRLGTTPRA